MILVSRRCLLITRPKNLVKKQVKINFNFFNFNELEVDLEHINKQKRSNYGLDEVTKVLIETLHNTQMQPVGTKKFSDEFCEYYVAIGKVGNKKIKIVFCICTDRPKTIGVITLHRV